MIVSDSKTQYLNDGFRFTNDAIRNKFMRYRWMGFKETGHSITCPLCKAEVKAVQIGIMGDYRYGRQRCHKCTLCYNTKLWNILKG